MFEQIMNQLKIKAAQEQAELKLEATYAQNEAKAAAAADSRNSSKSGD